MSQRAVFLCAINHEDPYECTNGNDTEDGPHDPTKNPFNLCIPVNARRLSLVHASNPWIDTAHPGIAAVRPSCKLGEIRLEWPDGGQPIRLAEREDRNALDRRLMAARHGILVEQAALRRAMAGPLAKQRLAILSAARGC